MHADGVFSTMIGILVVAHLLLVRRALCARLSVEPDMRVVAEADSVSAGASLTRAQRPHIVLLDAEMPDLKVREAVRSLRGGSPQSGVVILALDPHAVTQQLDGEAAVVVGKHEEGTALVVAIRAAIAGGQGD
jgi:DNA-binding NarL/FixJ family response regulator